MFGIPELQTEIESGKITKIKVLRGAPCGATWKAINRIIGLSIEEAQTRYALETQYFCSADPAGWDPTYDKSPLHIAGELHKNALKQSINRIL